MNSRGFIVIYVWTVFTLLYVLLKEVKIRRRISNVPIFYINLPEAVDRSASVEQSFSKFNLQRVDALSADSVEVQALVNRSQHRSCEWGKLTDDPALLRIVACSLSHLKAISIAYRFTKDYALIVEDDVVTDLLPFWTMSLEEFFSALPVGWKIVQLSLTGEPELWSDIYTEWKVKRFPPVLMNSSFWGTVAYAINKSGMEYVLDKYRTLNGFDLSMLPCINADIHLLKDAVPQGTYFIATPPLFTFSDGSSYIRPSSDLENLSRRFAYLPETNVGFVHFLSRKFALEWNALLWRARQARF